MKVTNTLHTSSELKAFTLIELSIVLVIIGLIVGGVLVGRDLIAAATVRAQITQIEKFNTAVNTFRGKFAALPGDMRPEIATQFNFTPTPDCGGSYGTRDGDFLFESITGNYSQQYGEAALFWQDLTDPAAGNITDLPFLHGTGATISCGTMGTVTGTPISTYIPSAKLNGLYVYVFTYSNNNYYGLSNITHLSGLSGSGSTSAASGIPVNMAFNIDKKLDDGIPTTGKVTASFPNYIWATPPALYNNSAATDSATTCYNTTSNSYSISSAANNGAGANCGLSFRFQ